METEPPRDGAPVPEADWSDQPDDVSSRVAAQRLGIAASTLRLYARTFARLLSPGARGAAGVFPPTGPHRRTYAEADLVVLTHAHELVRRGLSYEEALVALTPRTRGKRVRSGVASPMGTTGSRVAEPVSAQPSPALATPDQGRDELEVAAVPVGLEDSPVCATPQVADDTARSVQILGEEIERMRQTVERQAADLHLLRRVIEQLVAQIEPTSDETPSWWKRVRHRLAGLLAVTGRDSSLNTTDDRDSRR